MLGSQSPSSDPLEAIESAFNMASHAVSRLMKPIGSPYIFYLRNVLVTLRENPTRIIRQHNMYLSRQSGTIMKPLNPRYICS